MKPRVTIIRNEDFALVLVHREGRVISANNQAYLGLLVEEARDRAITALRHRLGSERYPAVRNGEPEVIEL
jgi:hypothetical protein